ncbi:hypothetical protein GUJ93_ZPchr0011g28490 [Zizania palustris]|uniref:Uncharacterized protein n=1 Tax=Zizania palustris TaxID=103762 RepID=A0A8J5WGW8_ZIZPA|nr:hypothetical protein GUJ93_ZPchr0011g28490 [Zizania palustris]
MVHLPRFTMVYCVTAGHLVFLPYSGMASPSVAGPPLPLPRCDMAHHHRARMPTRHSGTTTEWPFGYISFNHGSPAWSPRVRLEQGVHSSHHPRPYCATITSTQHYFGA